LPPGRNCKRKDASDNDEQGPHTLVDKGKGEKGGFEYFEKMIRKTNTCQLNELLPKERIAQFGEAA
jgi:hypothetical protein